MINRSEITLVATALAVGVSCKAARGQSLSDVIEFGGTVQGTVNATITYDGVTASGSTSATWDENGLVSGSGFLAISERAGNMSINRSLSTPVSRTTYGNGDVEIRASQSFGAIMSHASHGAPPVSVVYDAFWTLDSAVVIRIANFVVANMILTTTGDFSFTNPHAINVADLQADESTTYASLSGPRGLSIADDASGVLLVPGEYALGYNATGSVHLSGTLIQSGLEIARYHAGGRARVRITGFAGVPAVYDLDSDGVFSIEDLREWREHSGNGDPIYDTLGDGIVGDEDRAELFRALTFADPDAIDDCDKNGRHDPFEMTYDGVTPACVCLADLAAPFGVLNFFDVSAYIAFYNAQDARADFAAPFGVFNFFDVSAFIAAYNAGCP